MVFCPWKAATETDKVEGIDSVSATKVAINSSISKIDPIEVWLDSTATNYTYFDAIGTVKDTHKVVWDAYDPAASPKATLSRVTFSDSKTAKTSHQKLTVNNGLYNK